jgi:hypothetical protein
MAHTQSKRHEGRTGHTSKLGTVSMLCSQPADEFYMWCYWQVPLEVHERYQCYPLVAGWDEAKPREYNV